MSLGLWRAKEQARIPFYRAAQKLINILFSAEGKIVSAAVRSSSDPKTTMEIEIDKHAPNWRRKIVVMWRVVLTTFGDDEARRHGGKTLGLEDVPKLKAEDEDEEWVWDPWTENVQTAVNAFVAQKIVAVTDKTKLDVAAVIDTGMAQGHSIDRISRDIRRVYSGFTEHRSYRIARTEVIGASNFGSRQAILQSRIPFSRTWISSRDDRVRESHAQIDGETIPNMWDLYSNGLLFPGDPSGPPREVIHCRCVEKFSPQLD